MEYCLCDMFLYCREIAFVSCELNKNVQNDITLLKQMATAKAELVQCWLFIAHE